MEKEKGWNLLCKFFDNMGPIPHHMHQSDATRGASAAAASPRPTTSRRSTTRPTTTIRTPFMGLEPGTTKDDVRGASRTGTRGDNGITYLSRAYRLERGTGWQIDPGILHAPGIAAHLRAAGEQRRLRDVPVGSRRTHDAVGPAGQGRAARQARDLDYIIGMLDWDANVNAEVRREQPLPAEAGDAVRADRRRGLPRSVGRPTARSGTRRRN
jgi:hypothetical protein